MTWILNNPRRFIAFATGFVLLIAVFIYLSLARPVATGYAAKQLCSGVAVSGLPEQWLVHEMILPALAPVSSLISVHYDHEQNAAFASLLGYTAKAQYRGSQGCGLVHSDTPQGETAEWLVPELSDSAVWPQGNRFQSPLTSEVQEEVQQAVDEAFSEPDEGIRKTLAIAVAYDGKLIAERYQAPVTKDTPLQGWSMAKSLLSTWIAMQVQRGSLTESAAVNNFLPADLSEDISHDLTLGHLLRMESGLGFAEQYQPGDDVTQMLYRESDAWRWVATRDQQFTPGEHWQYSSGDSNLAAYIWKKSLLQDDYAGWLQQNFWRPLNITTATVESDENGTPVASSYAYMTTRDWLRVGQLWLDAYHNKPAVLENTGLERNWMKHAVEPSDADPDKHFGASFWLNRKGSEGSFFPELPESLFWARGHDGQFLMVIPELNLVVVRLGLTPVLGDEGVDTLLSDLVNILESSESDTSGSRNEK